MRLDRNDKGRNKYALIKNRVLANHITPTGDLTWPIREALEILERAGILDWGDKPETEFFVIRLKDKYAGRALRAYSVAAYTDDREYAEEIKTLANRAGADHPNCKIPD